MTAQHKIAAASAEHLVKAKEMDVPVGHKKTGAGVIPQDWNLVTFGSIITTLKGGANLSPSDFISMGLPVIPKSAITWGAKLRIRANEQQFCHENLKNKFASNIVDQSYSLIVLRDLVPSGPNIGLVVEIEEANDFLLAQGVYGFKIKPNYDPRYFAQLSNSSEYRKIMKSILVGSTQVHIRSSSLKETEFPFPPSMTEQTAIANALSDVDTLINELEKLITKKQAIKTASMQQLLTGRTRLPQFALREDGTKKGYKKTELGEIPEDWEKLTFGETLSIRHGKSQKEIEVTDGCYPILATGGEIGRSNISIYDKPSVLIGRKGTINQPRYIDTPFWTVDTLFFSEIKHNFNAKFIFYKFCLIDWMSYNEASGVPSLNASTIEGVAQYFPVNPEEQTAIAQILSDIDSEIQALQQRLTKTRHIKQGMMQELLTGKIRLLKPLGN